MAGRRYSYPKFLDHQSIRLVRIASPLSGDACAVDHHDTKNANTVSHVFLEVAQFPMGCEPRYRALSYTWGPPKDGHARYHKSDKITIVLDGEEHDVTPNLFDAIMQMSKSYDNSYFWIDALCINQGDLKERQLHVAIMDRIYRNAEEVTVWLGKAENDSQDVLELVEKVARKDESFFHAFGHSASPRQLCEYGLPDTSDPIWSRYLDLYECRWFNRGWVIQEVVLGHRALVHLGPFKIPWEDLVAGSKLFLPERLRKTFFASFRKTQDIDSLPLGRNVYRIGLIQEACIQSNFQSLLLVEICTGTHGLDSAEHILLHLMRMSRDFECGDLRDKVYSLLGLINYTTKLHNLPPLALKPDYSENSTPATVLTAAAAAIIKQSNYLGILAQVSDPSFRKIEGLPSWVPDFFRSPNLSMGRRNLFNASSHQRMDKSYFHFQDLSLTVRGTKVGVLQGTQDLKHDNKIGNILDMLKIASESVLPLGQDRVEVLWRTMIWDIYGHAHVEDLHPAPSFLADSFFSWIYSILEGQADQVRPVEWMKGLSILQPNTWLTNTEGGGEETSTVAPKVQSLLSHLGTPLKCKQADPVTFTSHASGVTWSQQLFLMNTRYLGMGPKSGAVGDEVWIVSGCSFPMVFRRIEGKPGSYSVLGRAYVHGVMHGEAVGGNSVWEEVRLE
ncbi:Fc.00g094080.m01.CDS01 [Cosmosporella sp. VM-42]